jgi:hypothetical protein
MNKTYFETLDIINSIKFYLMLGIICKQNENFNGDPNASLNNFLKELKEDRRYNEDKILRYSTIAVETLPSEFLKIYHIDGIDRR